VQQHFKHEQELPPDAAAAEGAHVQGDAGSGSGSGT
jgi:hypothetical protein